MRKKTTSAKVSSKIQNVIKIAINSEKKRKRRRHLRRVGETRKSSGMMINVSAGGNNDVSRLLHQVSTERAIAELGSRVDQLVSNPLFKSVLPTPSLTLGEVSRGLTRPLDDPSTVLTHTGEREPPTTSTTKSVWDRLTPFKKKKIEVPTDDEIMLKSENITTPNQSPGKAWQDRQQQIRASKKDDLRALGRKYFTDKEIRYTEGSKKGNYMNNEDLADKIIQHESKLNSGGGGAFTVGASFL